MAVFVVKALAPTTTAVRFMLRSLQKMPPRSTPRNVRSTSSLRQHPLLLLVGLAIYLSFNLSHLFIFETISSIYISHLSIYLIYLYIYLIYLSIYIYIYFIYLSIFNLNRLLTGSRRQTHFTKLFVSLSISPSLCQVPLLRAHLVEWVWVNNNNSSSVTESVEVD